MDKALSETASRAPGECISGWIEAAGVSLRYRLSGAVAADAASAVLIHELGGSLASWDAVVAELDPVLRILRFDQRGHGESEKTRTAYTLDDQVADLRGLIVAAQLPRPFWLVGAAAGAAIAVAYCAGYPDEVAGIVMCAPALDVDPKRRTYLRERAERAMRDGMRAIADATLANSYPLVRGFDPVAQATYRARFLANDPVSYALANQALSEIDLSDALAALRCPCLLLAGHHDIQRPVARVALHAATLADVEMRMIGGAHLMAVQVPTQVARHILDFCTRRSQAAAQIARPKTIAGQEET